jgi:glutaredoxin
VLFFYQIMQENQEDNRNTGNKKPRRINGMVIIMLVVAGLIFVNYKPSVARIHCNDEILNNKPEVIMLGTWWCPYCYQARRYLTDNNISYCEYDIERSAEGERLFNDVNGQAIPVLLIDKYVISGFDEARLERLLSGIREAS